MSDSEFFAAELRKFPKVKAVTLFRCGEETTAVIETNDVYLLNEDKTLRSKLGQFLIVLDPQKVLVRNSTPLGSHKTGWGYDDGSHHPHVNDNYVSLADHKKPLETAIEDEDWITAGSICFKFLEDFKFGEKAKKFFLRHTEQKVDGKWVLIEGDEREALLAGKEFQFISPTTYTSNYYVGKYRPVREFLEKHFPEGTRIRLVAPDNKTYGRTPKAEAGWMGTVNKVYERTMEVQWDKLRKENSAATYWDSIRTLWWEEVPENGDVWETEDGTVKSTDFKLPSKGVKGEDELDVNDTTEKQAAWYGGYGGDMYDYD